MVSGHLTPEYHLAGDLAAIMKHNQQNKICMSEQDAMFFIVQVMLGIQFMHSKRIIHRDLKPGNIFLMRNSQGVLQVKLGDFGISRVFDSIMVTQKFAGTPKYMAPEIYLQQPYNFPVDVWSIGCLLFEMLTNKIPFPATSLPEITKKVTTMEPDSVPDHLGVSQEVKALIKQMLIKNPQQRPTMNQVVEMPVVMAYVMRINDMLVGG